VGDTEAHCVGGVGGVCERMGVCGVSVYVYGACESVSVVYANVVCGSVCGVEYGVCESVCGLWCVCCV